MTGLGDINTYSIFSELASSLVNKKGRTGIIVPTGIATDDGNKTFFGNLVETNRLVSLFDFENKEAIFPSVHRSYKFCLLTISGADIGTQKASFGFFLTRVEHLQDKLRVFVLSKADFLRLNPNTKTCPTFRTNIDAEITNRIYKRSPVVFNEITGENPWNIRIRRLFDMGNLKISSKVLRQGNGNKFASILESKMLWQYDHRFSTYEGLSDLAKSNGSPRESTQADKSNSEFRAIPRNYINEYELPEIASEWFSRKKWCLGYRDVTNSTNERTIISSIYPSSCTDFTIRVQFFKVLTAMESCLLISNYNSLILDFVCRQKIGGMHIADYIFYQLPVLSKEIYTSAIIKSIIERALHLIYTSWDIKAFADDIWMEANAELKEAIQEQWQANQIITGGHTWSPPDWAEQPANPNQPGYTGCPLPPFKWDEERRAVLKAELDAIYAKLYGLTTDELRYILDPQDVYGPDFPGETFRVLKEKEIRLYGEYRTRRLVLEAWERLNKES